jgi:hypothetical protein
MDGAGRLLFATGFVFFEDETAALLLFACSIASRTARASASSSLISLFTSFSYSRVLSSAASNALLMLFASITAVDDLCEELID